MKIALLGDVHFSIKNGDEIFRNNIKDFFSKTFFPTIKSMGISTVLQTGDLFDNRKNNNNLAIENAKECFFEVMQDSNIDFHCIVGNHDMFYLHKISPNAPELYLAEYRNVHVYSYPTTIELGGKKIDMVPWICDENKESILKYINKSASDIIMGHFEIIGFEMMKGHLCDSGLDPNEFKKYSKVWSGHFHSQSTLSNIHYLGSPSHHTWGDVGEIRGFHVYDTDTNTMEFVKNPHELYVRIEYNDDIKIKDTPEVLGKFVRIMLPEEYNVERYKSLLDELWSFNPIDIKAIESKVAIDGMEISLEDVESTAFSLVDFLTEYTKSISNDDEIDTNVLEKMYTKLYNDSVNGV